MATREDYVSIRKSLAFQKANAGALERSDGSVRSSMNSGDAATARTRSDGTPTDSALRYQYERLERAFQEGLERDRNDVAECLERERRFNVDWNRHSRNKIWAAKDNDVPIRVYEGTVEEYKEREVWPRGRDLRDLSIYGQIKDFFLFMWNHTKPYKTVAMIIAMSIIRPFQVAILGYITQAIQKDPRGVPLWLYFAPFYGECVERCMYWWYEMWVPLNSQRVQLRCVLLLQRTSLPDHHPLAAKWPSGRFTGLLKDVDDVINGIWKSCLDMFDDLVTIAYLIILCFLNLAASVEQQGDPSAYGAYVGLFLGLGICIMGLPFVWFYLFQETVQVTEAMVRDGQALYMSTSTDAVAIGSKEGQFLPAKIEADSCEKVDDPKTTAVKSFWIYGRTTFRAFFHRLAWKTNGSLLQKVLGPVVGYILLTMEGFGESFDTSNIVIVLLSLKEMTKLSGKVLDYLIKMGRACNTLIDVAELLNTKADLDHSYLEPNKINNSHGKDEETGGVEKYSERHLGASGGSLNRLDHHSSAEEGAEK